MYVDGPHVHTRPMTEPHLGQYVEAALAAANLATAIIVATKKPPRAPKPPPPPPPMPTPVARPPAAPRSGGGMMAGWTPFLVAGGVAVAATAGWALASRRR